MAPTLRQAWSATNASHGCPWYSLTSYTEWPAVSSKPFQRSAVARFPAFESGFAGVIMIKCIATA
jgi:hypothetical protein